MAYYKGKQGIVKVGSGPVLVGDLRNWTIDSNSERIDASVMGQASKRFDVAQTETTVALELLYDAGDAGQALLVPGTQQDVKVYPNGEASGEIEISINVTFSGDRKDGGTFDGLVSRSVSAYGNDLPTEATLP